MRRLICVVALALAGCVNSETVYKSDAGQTGVCSGTAFGIISSIVTQNEIQKCQARYLAAGFHEVK